MQMSESKTRVGEQGGSTVAQTDVSSFNPLSDTLLQNGRLHKGSTRKKKKKGMLSVLLHLSHAESPTNPHTEENPPLWRWSGLR